MTWIIGEIASKKIEYVAKSFFDSRKLYAQSLFSKNFSNYLPWMASLELAEAFSRLDENYYRANSLFQFEEAKLLSYKNILNSSNGFELFTKDENSLEIFSDIMTVLPNAYNEFSDAWNLLNRSCPWISKIASVVVKEIVPVRLRSGQMIGAGGATNHHLIGTLFLSIRTSPFDIVKLAISIAHEIGHTALMIIQQGDSISLEKPEVMVYSGVRKCDRPLIMSFHAAVALGYMIESAKSFLAASATPEEVLFLKEFIGENTHQLESSLYDLKKFKFTEIGRKIIKDLDHLCTRTKILVPV